MPLPHWIEHPNPDIFLSDDYLVIDVENTNKSKGSALEPTNRLLYTHIKNGSIDQGIIGGELELGRMAAMIEQAAFIVAHNAKHELQWLVRAGFDISHILAYDTLLGEYVIAGNRRMPLDLNSTMGRYGVGSKDTYVNHLIKSGVCPSTIPPSLLHKYCRQDVVGTEAVFLQQRAILKEQGLLPVFFSRCIFTPVVADLEATGLFLDQGLVHQIHNESVESHLTIIKELDEITGGINMGSTAQVAHFLYETLGFPELSDRRKVPIRNKPSKQFPDGVPKTDEDTIAKLVPKNKGQKRFLELKAQESKLRKKINSYTTRFVGAVENDGCILHGKLNQSVTVTHRLSSSAPNLQNIDRTLKKVITAREPGWSIHEIDYSQLEYRIAGFLAQCPDALKAIVTKEDVHAFTASVIFKEEWEDILAGTATNRSEVRTEAKSHTFKPLYGGMSGSEREVAYYKAFLEKHPAIKEMHDRWLEEVLATGSLKTVTGLRFYFPGTEYTRSGYVTNSTNIKNYPVQMFATADIVPLATTLLWHEFKSRQLKSFIINEVHDSIIIEEDPSEEDVIRNLAEEIMSKEVVKFVRELYDIDINFPLEIDHKVMTNWGYNKPKEELK